MAEGQAWAKDGSPALFLTHQGKHVSARMIQRLVSDCARLAGLTKSVTPHAFRHSHCTEIQLRGASMAVARELLDHASISTTSRYSHASDEALKRALASLNDPKTWED